MKVIRNIIWFVYVGLLSSVYYFIASLLLCSIIGISLGKQCFKLIQLALIPFEANV